MKILSKLIGSGIILVLVSCVSSSNKISTNQLSLTEEKRAEIPSAATVASPNSHLDFIHNLEQETNLRTDIPSICSDLPENLQKNCTMAVSLGRQQYAGRQLGSAIGRVNCYSPNAMREIAAQERDVLGAALLSEDFNSFFWQYDNMANCYWSSNDFTSAKHYFDGIYILKDILPLLDPEMNGIILGAGRALPNTPETAYWHVVRQAVRFYENILRTKWVSMCGRSGNDCRAAAWQLTNQSNSILLNKNLILSIVSHSQERDRELAQWSKLLRLKAKAALLEMAEREQILKGSGEWAKQLRQEIQSTEKNLPESLRDVWRYSNISLDATQSLLRGNDLLLIYSQSIECRPYIIWQISRTRADLMRAKVNRNECQAGIIKQRIMQVWEHMRPEQNLDSVKMEMQELAEILIGNTQLPKSKGTLYMVLDEGLAGLPFELLPTSSGTPLGFIYSIKYAPSLPVFAYARNKIKLNAGIPYFGISRDTHPDLGNLNVDAFIRDMSKEYNGQFLADASITKILANRTTMENAKVLQFISHSTEDGNALAFDRPLTWDDLGRDLLLKADIVLLTACSSVGLRSDNLGEAFSTLVRGFLTAGALNVIATRWEITQDDAKDFSELFLGKYRTYNNIDKAYFETINEFHKKYPTEPNRWASWMLVGS